MTLLWDYLHGPGRNEMQSWGKKVKLGVKERAQLNQKLDMLERIGFEEASRMAFLAGTTGEYNHIFKLRIHSDRMLRPMLCRGPADKGGEITLLGGAIEKDFTLEPSDAAERADEHRRNLVDDSGRRISHERF